MKHVTQKKYSGWLLFFYSAPSKPVSNRMKIWRKLIGAGAVQMKGAVYILPFNDEHYEFLQWLVSEVAGMKGEAGFASVERVETMKDAEIRDLFNEQRSKAYHPVGKGIDELERKLSSIQKGSKTQNIKSIFEQLSRLTKDFEDIHTVDFFSTSEGTALQQRIKRVRSQVNELSGTEMTGEKPKVIVLKLIGDYKGKIWMTRKRPFVDRMASAWLIKRFIDRNAVFDFIDEKDMETIGKGYVTFDIRGGEFTHAGDLCTFEAMVKAFRLKDKALRKITEIVHELDMKDGKYAVPEARGIEGILAGLRKSVKDDAELLEKGMAVFEMLYISKT